MSDFASSSFFLEWQDVVENARLVTAYDIEQNYFESLPLIMV